jgi:hypothetical protein
VRTKNLLDLASFPFRPTPFLSDGQGVPHGQERRRATRVATSISARLIGPDGVARAVELDNLSVVGLFGSGSHPLPLGTRCRIELGLGGASVEAHGTIVRSQGRSLALRFDQVPFESFERLRAFLLANAQDPAVIADELTERLGYLGESA